ncbi:conjugal transfer protein TraH [uncultured Parasutterella sp.]|uniref:conjugal transfer protein TraH n=1 Tax=uncultured Parasutterella sp. TaxID=1263098 RepID=UPI00272A1732|nr:conjugal transfer protein TraH [uncultured Parasutterella sp.]
MIKLKKILCAALCAVSVSTSANAGFMKDFYSAAGSYQGNLTEAGVYQSAGMNTVTAGGFVYRAPRKDFNAFYFTPPSLSAGCGGIDIFMGAFGIPSREEFVAFLRNIGTALPGLAFQLALQSLAPDLNEQVTSFRDMIRQYTGMFQDSCTTAQNLIKMSGAEQWLHKLSYDSKNELRSSGTVSDASEADAMTRTNGSAVIENSPTRRDSGGNIVDAPELNLTWSLLSGGKFSADYSDELKELMMTLVGTVIYVQEGSGNDAVTRAIPIAGQDLVGFLFGRPDEEALDAESFRLRCVKEDGGDRCLTVRKTPLDEMNLPYEFMRAAAAYRNSILSRDPSLVSKNDLTLLASSSTIPLIRLINATTSHRYLGFSQDVLRIYVEAAAYEAVIRAMDRLSLDIKTAISASSASQTSVIAADHLKAIEQRVDAVRRDLADRSDAVFQQMSRTHSFVTQISHLERSVKGALAADLAANLKFGAAN